MAGTVVPFAGGGIVADSEEAAEYQETFDKVNRILQQLENPLDHGGSRPNLDDFLSRFQFLRLQPAPAMRSPAAGGAGADRAGRSLACR